MDKILKVFVAKNAVKLACLGVGVALVACDSGDSSSTLQIAWENPSSSAEFVASSGDAGLSSVEISSSSGWFKKGDFLNPDIEYGTLVDTRDGKTYSTVVIGDLTWMAENLNYADSVQDPILKGATRCIDECDENCNVLGRLYDMKVVTEIDSSKLINKGLIYYEKDYQGICPDGWRIPSMDDWVELLKSVNHYTKSESRDWVYNEDSLEVLLSGKSYVDQKSEFLLSDTSEIYLGTDLYGFSALPMSLTYWYSDLASYLNLEYCCAEGPILRTSYGWKIFSMSTGPYVGDLGIIRCVKGGESVGEFSTRDDLLNPNVKYDILVDERDGQIYRTYKGVMAENLNYDDGKALCYNNDERLCALYGRLYGQESLNGDSLDGPCPEGWMLPKYFDYSLLNAKGWDSDYLKSYSDPSGDDYKIIEDEIIRLPDEYDNEVLLINVFPSGCFVDDEFVDNGSLACFHVSSSKVVFFGNDSDGKYYYNHYDEAPSYGKFSIRCVEKDRYGNVDGNQ